MKPDFSASTLRVGSRMHLSSMFRFFSGCVTLDPPALISETRDVRVAQRRVTRCAAAGAPPRPRIFLCANVCVCGACPNGLAGFTAVNLKRWDLSGKRRAPPCPQSAKSKVCHRSASMATGCISVQSFADRQVDSSCDSRSAVAEATSDRPASLTRSSRWPRVRLTLASSASTM